MTRVPHRLAVRLIAGLLALSIAGCGLTMTHGPPAGRPPDQRPSCTETMDAPKKDAYGAAIGFFGILIGLLILEADGNEKVGVPLIIGGAVVTVGSYASGGIGYYRVKKCRRAISGFHQTHPEYGPYVAPRP